MITAAQLRAARVLLGIDQRRLAELSGLSVPTIQRMEASETMVRGNVDSLVKLITAFDARRDRDDRRRSRQQFAGARGAAEDQFRIGQDLSGPSDRDNKASSGTRARSMMSAVVLQMSCVAGLLGLGDSGDRSEPQQERHGGHLQRDAGSLPGSHCSGPSAGCSAARPNATELTLPIGLPWLGAHFRLDALASFFLVVVNLGGAAASLYGLGYGHHEHGAAPRAAVLPRLPGRHESGGAGGRRVFLSAVLGIHVAGFLGAGDGASPRSRQRQGGLRLSGDGELRHAGAAAGLRPAGGTGGRLRICRHSHRADIRRTWPTLVLILMLLGAGSKAGLVPLHVWLPLAHPAAPSHVSALMSGVMTKVAIYGFIRVIFDLLGQPTWPASVIVLFLGGITAVMGILYAMMEKDLKRLLAYSTIENVGIIFVSLGLALAFQANGLKLRGGARLHGGAVSRAQPLVLQEPAVLRRRRRPDVDRRARHGQTGRPDPPHAAHQLRRSGRLRRDLGAAAVQRLRFGMADLPGRAAKSGAAAMGAEDHGARGRRACWRWRRRWPRRASSRPSA